MNPSTRAGNTAPLHAAQPPALPYAAVTDVAVSWQTYLRLAADLGDALPPGVILHAAGRTDAGVRLIGVCATESAYRAWARLLDPALARHVDTHLTPPFVRELELAHLIHPR